MKRFADTINFHVMGNGFTWKSSNIEKDRKLARKGWALAEEAMSTNRFDLVVLDELTYLLLYEMIDLETVLEALAARPATQHVVITGRGAPHALIKAADLVKEILDIKHPLKSVSRRKRVSNFRRKMYLYRWIHA